MASRGRVALTLAERGYAVAANDLDAPEETLKELERLGAQALSVPGDVSDEGAVRGMVGAVMGGNGHALTVDGGWFGDGSWESLRRRKQAP